MPARLYAAVEHLGIDVKRPLSFLSLANHWLSNHGQALESKLSLFSFTKFQSNDQVAN